MSVSNDDQVVLRYTVTKERLKVYVRKFKGTSVLQLYKLYHRHVSVWLRYELTISYLHVVTTSLVFTVRSGFIKFGSSQSHYNCALFLTPCWKTGGGVQGPGGL